MWKSLKKTRWETVNQSVEPAKESRVSISALCSHMGMSRQNYYAARRLRQRREVDEQLVVELVKQERRLQPRLGGRKLLYLLRDEFAEAGVTIGRDRFFEVLAENNLLVPRKPSKARTTNSRHSLPVFHNLLAEATLTAPNEAWVSDITYIRTKTGDKSPEQAVYPYNNRIIQHLTIKSGKGSRQCSLSALRCIYGCL